VSPDFEKYNQKEDKEVKEGDGRRLAAKFEGF